MIGAVSATSVEMRRSIGADGMRTCLVDKRSPEPKNSPGNPPELTGTRRHVPIPQRAGLTTL